MIKIKILVVEDESIVALDIQSALGTLGYEVTDLVTNYDEALESVKKAKPDIILMDINLDHSKDGIEIAESIQKTDNIPILYLTAFSDDKTIERAIKTNPMGYLIKPFKRKELKSTILLGLHKINQANQTDIDQSCTELGFNYYYNLNKEQLYYTNMPVKLSVKENLLLKILIEAKGRIVTFQDLEYEIWPHDPISESALRTLIYRTRTKLEYKLIETIPTFGCKLILPN